MVNTDAGFRRLCEVIAESASLRGMTGFLDLNGTVVRQFAARVDALAAPTLTGRETATELKEKLGRAVNLALDEFFATPNRKASLSGSN